MRFYIVPVYLADPEKRPKDYVPGLYEIAEEIGRGRYRMQLAMFKDPKILEQELQTRFEDFLEIKRTKDEIRAEIPRQLENMNFQLASQAKDGKFNEYFLRPMVEGKNQKLETPQVPHTFKYKSKIFEIEHPLFRVYGVRYKEALIVTGLALKTQAKMNPADRQEAERILSILNTANFHPSLLSTTPLPINYNV